MSTTIKRALSRHRAHAYLLFAAFVSLAVGAQPAGLPGLREGRPPQPQATEQPSPEIANQSRQQALEAHQRAGRSATARGAVGSVAVAARCVEGYVVNSSHRASAPDAKVVAAERAECDGGRCRAYQVTAARDGNQPFDLEVSVTCS